MIYKFISIEGNIGAGKTTLASLLAEEYHGQLILEAFEDNPYLPKFYEDNGKYALQLEMCQNLYMQEEAPFAYDAALAAQVQPQLRGMLQAALNAGAALVAGGKYGH